MTFELDVSLLLQYIWGTARVNIIATCKEPDEHDLRKYSETFEKKKVLVHNIATIRLEASF